MQQEEVLEFLEKNKDTWFSSREVINNFPNEYYLASVTECLRKLKEKGLIEMEELCLNNGRNSPFRYKFKVKK